MPKRKDPDSLKRNLHKAQKKSISVERLVKVLRDAEDDLREVSSYRHLRDTFGFDDICGKLLAYNINPSENLLKGIEQKISEFLALEQKHLPREDRAIFSDEASKLFDKARKNRGLRTLSQLLPDIITEGYVELGSTALDSALKGFFSKVHFVLEAINQTLMNNIKIDSGKSSNIPPL
jgi:hypothetical protein